MVISHRSTWLTVSAELHCITDQGVEVNKMDKSQMRDALKGIKNSLPKEITVVVKNEKDGSYRTISSVVKEITVGKGYKGSYTAKLETGDIISSLTSDEVVSMTIDGVLYNKEQEKKVYNQKPAINEETAKNLYTIFASLKKDDIVDINSTENRFNQRFKVISVEPVHAPFKQYKISVQKPDGNGPIATFLSRRDSGILRNCVIVNEFKKDIISDNNDIELIEDENESFDSDLIAD